VVRNHGVDESKVVGHLAGTDRNRLILAATATPSDEHEHKSYYHYVSHHSSLNTSEKQARSPAK